MTIRTLIAEDNNDVAKLITIYLETIDCEIVGHARDGNEAIEIYEEVEPELVVMDLKMPNMDGAVATKYILQLDADASIIVFTSAIDHHFVDDDNELVKRALKNGAVAAVSKFSRDALERAIARHFAKPG